MIKPEVHAWTVHRELASDNSTLEVINDQGTYRLEDIDLTVQAKAIEHYTCRANDYGSVRAEALWERGLSRGDWAVRTVTRTTLTSDPDAFFIRAELDAFETDEHGERRVFCRSWSRRIPRDHV